MTGFQDLAGNAGRQPAGDTALVDTVDIDTANPTVTVNIVDGSLNDADNSSLVTFSFSEPVNRTSVIYTVAGGDLLACGLDVVAGRHDGDGDLHGRRRL